MRKKTSKGGGVSIENIVEEETDDGDVLEEDDPEVVEFMKTRFVNVYVTFLIF